MKQIEKQMFYNLLKLFAGLQFFSAIEEKLMRLLVIIAALVQTPVQLTDWPILTVLDFGLYHFHLSLPCYAVFRTLK